MTKPMRVQLVRTDGWLLPPNTVNVARPTKWGNPFKIRPGQSRDEAILRYRLWIDGQPELLKAAKTELRGKNLACYCPTGLSCHADYLLQIANQSP